MVSFSDGGLVVCGGGGGWHVKLGVGGFPLVRYKIEIQIYKI